MESTSSENQPKVSETSAAEETPKRKVRPPKPYPTIAQGFGAFGIYLLFSLGVGLALASANLDKSLMTFLGTLVINAAVLAVLIGIGNLGGWKALRNQGRAPWSIYLLALLCLFSAVVVLEPVLSAIPMPDFMRKMLEDLIQKNIWSFLAIAVVAPVTEELLFRRVLLPGLIRNYGPWKGIVWSALFFAIFHLNPWQGIGAFIIGLLLGYIYFKTGDIWICMFLHATNNAFSFFMTILLDDPFATLHDLVPNTAIYLGILISAAVLAVSSWMLIKKRLDKVPEAEGVT